MTKEDYTKARGIGKSPDDGDFFWKVRVIDRKTTYLDDEPFVEEHPKDYLIEHLQFTEGGVRWKRSQEIGENSFVPGETMFVPFWRVVSVSRHHVRHLPSP